MERCRWCRRIFVSARVASIHEARCRLRQGAKPAFECRKCGRQFAQHFGRAKHLAHEQYCLGSAVANLTCKQCGEIFVHMNARRLHERFVLKSARMPMEWFIGRVCAVSRLGFLLTLLGGIGPQHNISNTFTTKIVGVVALNN